MCNLLFYFVCVLWAMKARIKGCKADNLDKVGGVNDRISDRAEILTQNFQLQYLLQLYWKNLTTVFEPSTGTLWIGWCWSCGSMDRIWADIPFESWLSEFWSCLRFDYLLYWGSYLPPRLCKQLNLEQDQKFNSQLSNAGSTEILPTQPLQPTVFVWLASHVLPYLSHRNVP